ncbi:cupredoxin family copper-binding protein [Candidatus Woesearchaeota archaeon]|nr:cupredoxin family copper-binding protein [Candidatus Woesearchaeota archaeon]
MKAIIPILAILSLLLVACGQTAPVEEKSGETLGTADQVVTINSFKFSPAEVTVRTGQTVVWKNQDSASHTIAIDGTESPELFNGDTWSHTFDTAGTFDYLCGIHPSMKGTVVVE